MRHDFAIVGAGVAGAYALYTILQKIPLQSKRRRIAIIEATDRCGGRMYSASFAGRSVQLGAGVIRDRDERVLRLAKQLGLPIAGPFTAMPGEIRSDGVVLASGVEEVRELIRDVVHSVERAGEAEVANTFPQHFFHHLTASERKRLWASWGFSDMKEMDSYMVIHHYSLYDVEGVGNFYSLVGEGGYANLVPAILRRAKEVAKDRNVDLEWIMEVKIDEVQIEDHKVTLCATTQASEATIVVRRCIWATNLEGLKNVVFKVNNRLCENPFPERLHAVPFVRIYCKFDPQGPLVQHLKMVRMVRSDSSCGNVILIDQERGLVLAVYTDSERAKLWGATMMDFATDNPATLPPSLLKLVARELQSLFPEIIIDTPTDGLMMFWKHGGIHVWKPWSALHDDQVDRHIKRLQTKTFPRLKFVGEMFSTKQGWVEGALESVERILI